MKTLGVSLSRNHLSALLREQSLLSSRLAFSCTVPCREPFGGPEDAARLAEEVRKRTGDHGLPPVVLSLPPSWTYLSQVELPVEDLQRAKKIHVSELEGSLPIEDEEILSDLLPSPPGASGRFLAIAARRSAVEKAVAVFAGAGFPLDRVITDHVSILSAVIDPPFRIRRTLFADSEHCTVLAAARHLARSTRVRKRGTNKKTPRPFGTAGS